MLGFDVLPAQIQGQWFYLYLILDLYSRKIVGFGVSPRSTRRARMSSARVMSADIEIWKAGACQASVIRRATVRRSEVSGTTSASNGVADVMARPLACLCRDTGGCSCLHRVRSSGMRSFASKTPTC